MFMGIRTKSEFSSIALGYTVLSERRISDYQRESGRESLL